MLFLQSKISKKFNLQSLAKANNLTQVKTEKQSQIKGGDNNPYYVH